MDVSGRELIFAEVKRQIEMLHSIPYTDLEALPEADTRKLEVAGTSVTLTVYRTTHPNGDLLVVVQACRERLLGIYHDVWVEGFVASANGTKLKAAENLLWDYT